MTQHSISPKLERDRSRHETRPVKQDMGLLVQVTHLEIDQKA